MDDRINILHFTNLLQVILYANKLLEALKLLNIRRLTWQPSLTAFKAKELEDLKLSKICAISEFLGTNEMSEMPQWFLAIYQNLWNFSDQFIAQCTHREAAEIWPKIKYCMGREAYEVFYVLEDSIGMNDEAYYWHRQKWEPKYLKTKMRWSSPPFHGTVMPSPWLRLFFHLAIFLYVK